MGRGCLVASALYRRSGARASARASCCQRVMLALAMAARAGLSSTPSTRRKGNRLASSMARPLPAPMSRKTVFWMGCGLVCCSQMSRMPCRMLGATP